MCVQNLKNILEKQIKMYNLRYSQNQDLYELSFKIQHCSYLWENVLKCFLVFCISWWIFFMRTSTILLGSHICYFILVFALNVFFFYLSIESIIRIMVNISATTVIATPTWMFVSIPCAIGMQLIRKMQWFTLSWAKYRQNYNLVTGLLSPQK